MKSLVFKWPYRWFGVWREHGSAYRNFPSVFDFVVPEVNKDYSKDDLRSYLASAPILATTSRANFLNPFTSERCSGSISFRTDGEWLWLDDLAEYVFFNGVVLPKVFLECIQRRGFVPPDNVAEESIANLDWPNVLSTQSTQ